MQTLLSHSLIAIAAGLIGGLSSSYFSSEPQNLAPIRNSQETILNSIDVQTYAPDDIPLQIQYLQQQVKILANKFSELAKQKTGTSIHINSEKINSTTIVNRDNIIYSGIYADVADEMLFRIEQQNNRRLELQSLIQNSDVSERREYSKELRELLKNKISLRSEMGDDAFDQYLFLNNQYNRVKVSSIMPGSAAEYAGILPNDIIIYYDNNKILNSTDIKSASQTADLASNVIVEINRDGEVLSLTLTSGVLDIEFEPIRVDPNVGH